MIKGVGSGIITASPEKFRCSGQSQSPAIIAPSGTRLTFLMAVRMLIDTGLLTSGF